MVTLLTTIGVVVVTYGLVVVGNLLLLLSTYGYIDINVGVGSKPYGIVGIFAPPLRGTIATETAYGVFFYYTTTGGMDGTYAKVIFGASAIKIYAFGATTYSLGA